MDDQEVWNQAAAMPPGDCPYCENRGVVSEVPGRAFIRGEWVDRVYSFKCVCFAAVRFAGLPPAESWMLEYARDRKAREADRLHEWRKSHGIDDETLPKFRETFRRFMESQKPGLFRKVSQAIRTEAPRNEQKPAKIASTAPGPIKTTPRPQESLLSDSAPVSANPGIPNEEEIARSEFRQQDWITDF